MSRQARGDGRSVAFEAFYATHAPSLLGYVSRRVEDSDVEDVLAQVFVVAWRRFDHVPAAPEDRLWLFGVARRIVADHRRSTIRRQRLHHRLARHVHVQDGVSSSFAELQDRVDRCLEALSGTDRDVNFPR